MIAVKYNRMPKPTNKKELIDLSRKHFESLNSLIDSLSDKYFDFPSKMFNRNIRDVLAHLHRWHLLFIDWYNDGMNGKKPEMPAKGFTWKTTSDLNKTIWNEYQAIDLQRVRVLFNESHIQILQIIEKHTDDELFEKKRYNWTGTTSLGLYLICATSSHYDWALKLIKKSLKE
jgi:hypothetical protein